MKIKALNTFGVALSLFLYGCVSPSFFVSEEEIAAIVAAAERSNTATTRAAERSNTPSTPAEEDQWTSLLYGMEMKYNESQLRRNQARYGHGFSEMRLSNGASLTKEKWESYLKDYVSSFPPGKRDDIVDGITRHYHEYDRVDQVIRFEPLRLASGPYSRASYVSMRGSLSPDSTNAFLRLRYYGRNWLFAEGVTISVDDEIVKRSRLNFNRNHAAGNIWEHTDLDLSDNSNRRVAEKIANGSQVIIRFHGRQYRADFEPTDRMKDDLRAMLRALDAIGS